MAHFAQLDSNNIVIKIIVVSNNELLDENNQESEAKGISFCKSLYGSETNWKQTSFNNKFRKKFAALDDFYDSTRDAFYAPKTLPDQIFNEETCRWELPIPPKPNIPGVALNLNISRTWEIVPKPAPSWVVNASGTDYDPPVPCPKNDGKIYFWNEQIMNWETHADYELE